MSDGNTTVVLVEAAIELAMIEKARVRLTIRGDVPGARDKLTGPPRLIEPGSDGASW